MGGRRGLVRRLSTGVPVGPWVDRFGYPFRWLYSVLNAAEYFRQAALFDGAPPDPRMADAIELVRAARQPGGTWLQAGRPPGRVWFEVDAPAEEPSKWLTPVRKPGARLVGLPSSLIRCRRRTGSSRVQTWRGRLGRAAPVTGARLIGSVSPLGAAAQLFHA